jgi:hypothetical protein
VSYSRSSLTAAFGIFGQSRWLKGLAALASVYSVGSLPCVAEVTGAASATAQYQSNSNPFALQAGNGVLGIPDSQRGDSFFGYGAEGTLSYLWLRQKLLLDLSATGFRYDRYTNLNHTEYLLDGKWIWTLSSAFDGRLEVSRARTMVTFVDLTQLQTQQLALQTDQRETVGVGFLFNPNWRLEGTAYQRGVDEPLTATPNLHLNESFGSMALKFVGRAGVTAGISTGYLSGDFSGTTAERANPSYRQQNADFVATYQASGHSTLTGEAGYSRRTSGNALNDVSGPTGALDYRNQLTPKTSVELLVNRAIISYIANTGSEIDTNATFNVNWQATYKVGVVLGYTWTDRNLPKQNNVPGTDRVDHLNYVSLKIAYRPFRWLVIDPYANVQTRRSNFAGANFDATVFGVYVTVQTKDATALATQRP